MKKILFVCKYNRFRSRVAEAYFKKIMKGGGVEAKSAGIFEGNPLDMKEVLLARTYGLDISGKPQIISMKLLKWQDAIILVADDVPPALFTNNKKYGKKLIVWKIKDRITSIKPIMEKVNKLAKALKGVKKDGK